MAGMDNLAQLLSTMPDAQRRKLLALGTVDDRRAQLQQQLQRVQGQQQMATPHTTAAGGILGGLGALLSQFNTQRKEGAINQQLLGLAGEQEGGRNLYAQALVEALRRRQRDSLQGAIGSGSMLPGVRGGM